MENESSRSVIKLIRLGSNGKRAQESVLFIVTYGQLKYSIQDFTPEPRKTNSWCDSHIKSFVCSLRLLSIILPSAYK